LVSLLLRRIRTGTLTVIEHGGRRVYGSGPPAAPIHARPAAMWGDGAPREPRPRRRVRRRSVGFAGPRRTRPPGGAQRGRAGSPARARRSRAGPGPARPRVPTTKHARSTPARHRRPLRPWQRAVLADARPDDELLVRGVRRGHDDARG